MLLDLSPTRPLLPRPLHRLLLRSERYRRWVRNRPDSPASWPERSKLPEYPKWRTSYDYDGYLSLYTRYKGRCYRLSENFSAYLNPPFDLTLERWGKINAGPFSAGLKDAEHVGWEELREVRFRRTDELEAAVKEWRGSLPEFCMEDLL